MDGRVSWTHRCKSIGVCLESMVYRSSTGRETLRPQKPRMYASSKTACKESQSTLIILANHVTIFLPTNESLWSNWASTDFPNPFCQHRQSLLYAIPLVVSVLFTLNIYTHVAQARPTICLVRCLLQLCVLS